jgi:hypothetical protein
MKRLLPLIAFFAAAPAAHADITVDGAASQATRIGSSYSVSGSNITLDTAGGLGALTAGSAVGYTAADYSVTTAGDAFSFSESFTEGDATPTATSVTSGVVANIPMLGSTTTTSGGVAGTLAGTIASDSAMTITAGGAGTTAIGQVILSVTAD